MYSYTLKICIISDDSYIEEVIGSAKPRQGFKHEIYTAADFSAESDIADIYIVDGRESLLKEVYGAKKADGIVAFYTDRVLEFKNFNRLWKKPVGREEMAFLFESMLDEIKLAKDSRLHLNYLDTLIDNSPDLIWFKDIKGSHVKVNESFCHAVSKTKEQVQGRGHYYIWDINPEEYSKGEYVCLESEDQVISAGRAMVFDENVKTKSGMRLFVTVKSPLFDEYGKILGTVGMAHDVTELNNVSREMDLFIENMPFGVIVSNEQDVILNVNDEMLRMTGWTRQEVVDYKITPNSAYKQEVISNTEAAKITSIIIPVGGENRIFELTKIHITDVFKQNLGIMRIFRDITAERRLEAQVVRTANTDFLTGLYNRRYFYSYINSNCMGKPVSLVAVDLDRFKSINDTYGHQMGDEALVLTAQVLEESFKDGVIARIGGDEFVVLLENADPEYITGTIERAYDNFVRAYSAKEEFANLGISIGVASTDCLDGDIDKLYNRSDSALYSVKGRHKGGYCISDKQ